MVWSQDVQQTGGGASSVEVNGVAVDVAGNVWVAGTFTGAIEIGRGRLLGRDGSC
jgi:hypothetical protein